MLVLPIASVVWLSVTVCVMSPSDLECSLHHSKQNWKGEQKMSGVLLIEDVTILAVIYYQVWVQSLFCYIYTYMSAGLLFIAQLSTF